MHIRIVLAHVHPYTKFGVIRSKGVRARGQKAEQINCPLGAQFWSLGADSPNCTQFRPRRFWPESLGSRPLPVWAAALKQHFSKGSRGGTQHMPCGTWHHVTAAIDVPLFRRIEWAVSRPDRPGSSGAIHETHASAGHFHARVLQPPQYSHWPLEAPPVTWNVNKPLLHFDWKMNVTCQLRWVLDVLVMLNNVFYIVKRSFMVKQVQATPVSGSKRSCLWKTRGLIFF